MFDVPDVEKAVELSSDPDTEGFDVQAGKTWIYPTNCTSRDYQFNIIQQALLKNTMVSLPTGLGKTFIAAVVMYNFYRWYPVGKIIFMAPTRPLVKQQVDACYNIMAIPKEVTAELTGTKVQTSRKEIWKQKRVFFITPQVLQNDLDILTEVSSRIKCLVFDEAHKAKGNHAYCEVIRKLSPRNKYFRVLGLSATPGSTIIDVLEVIHNLLISHLEIRTDDSPDVSPYIYERSLETVVVPLGGKLQEVRDSYMPILEKYTRVLIKHKVITGNCSTLTKGKIFMTMKEYGERNSSNRDRSYSEIMRNLSVCVTLYHGYELLIRHGLRGFLSFFEQHGERPLLRANLELQRVMQDVQEYLGPAPDVEELPDGSVLEIPETTKFGHPKFYKMRDILSLHFTDMCEGSTRVIVFCEYKESVMEAYALLLRHRPLIRPKIFLGQGAMTQRQQISVIKAFKLGECNTLVATCIGEEGLDVGDVDLIVCFDISNRSPVRMIQRMGRTGRKREGRVVVLVTEGKEQQTLKECLIHKQNLTNHILQSSAIHKEMYPHNPRMVPANIDPKCHKMYITVKPESNPQLPKKRNNIKDMFDDVMNKKSSALFLHDDNDTEILKINERIPDKQELWNKNNPLSINSDNSKIDFSKKLAKLRTLQPTGKIGHSRSSEMLVSLLQFADSKKYNIPITQVPVMPSQMIQPTKLKKQPSSNNLKQADIRNIFRRVPSTTDVKSNDGDLKSTQKTEETTLAKEILNQLFTEISNYLATNISDSTSHKAFENLFDCSQFITPSSEFTIKTWTEPDPLVFDSLTTKNLSIFAESLSPESNKIYSDFNSIKVITSHNNNTYIKKEDAVTPLKNLDDEVHYISRSILFSDDSFGLKQSPFKAPNNVQGMLKKCGIAADLNDSAFNNVEFTQMENTFAARPCLDPVNIVHNKTYESNIPCSLNATAFENTEFTQMKTKANKERSEDALTFFHISALEELFEDPCISTPHKTSISEDVWSQETIIYSVDEKSVEQKDATSPILCSFDKIRQLKNKAQKRLFNNSVQGSTSANCKVKTPDKNEMGETLKQNKAEILNNITSSGTNEKEKIVQTKPRLFKLLQKNEPQKRNFFVSKKNSPDAKEIFKKIDDREAALDQENNLENSEPDIIDTSLDNCLESIVTSQVVKRVKESKKNVQDPSLAEVNNFASSTDISDMIDLSVFGLDANDLSKQTIQKEKAQNSKADVTDSCKIACSKIVISPKREINVQVSDNICNKNGSVKGCITDLQDFCDNTFIDMFLEDDLFETHLSVEKNDCCKINSKDDTVSNEAKNVEFSTACENIHNNENYENHHTRDIRALLTEEKKIASHTECGNTNSEILEKNNAPSPILWKNINDNTVSNENNTLSDDKAQEKNEEHKLDKKSVKSHDDTNGEMKIMKFSQENQRKENYNDGDWEEESIWNFCVNLEKSEVANKIKSNSEPSSAAECKIKNTIANPASSLSTKKEESSESCKNATVTDKINEIKERINHSIGNKAKKDIEIQEENLEIVDLTEDSPTKYSSSEPGSPTLIKFTPLKSQRSKMTQPKCIMKMTEVNAISTKRFPEQSNRLKLVKTSDGGKANSRLQLNSNKNSITSMDWFKKNNNTENRPSATQLVVTKPTASDKMVTSTQISTLCRSPLSKPEFEDCGTDDSFSFTFNSKKPAKKSKPSKNPQNAFSVSKISPVLNTNNKFTKTYINTTPSKVKNLNNLLASDESDDDFEPKPRKMIGWIKANTKNVKTSPVNMNANRDNRQNRKTVFDGRTAVKRKLEQCPYIDLEAEMSSDEHAVSDSDQEETDSDKFEDSFVDDETQNVANTTAMQAQYLQSVRSPLLNRGKFKIPEKPYSCANVYSQPVNDTENTYINDTFCVNTEDVDLSEQIHDISELEMAELILEEERKNRKRSRKKSDTRRKMKRVRLLESSSDSD